MEPTNRIAIYLAGNIKKCFEKVGDEYWGKEEMDIIINTLKPCEVDFLHPGVRNDDLSDQLSVFGRDMTQVYCSNVVFVDARHRRGLGVGAEMMWAAINRIPVVTLCPAESHYHKRQANILDMPVSNWIHPFIEGLSDVIVPTIEEGASWMLDCVVNQNKTFTKKDINHIKNAMRYYCDTQSAHDVPMLNIINNNSFVSEKIQDTSKRIMSRRANASK